MAKPNYAFEKRQRDLAKKKKKEEKLEERRHRKTIVNSDGTTSTVDSDEPSPGTASADGPDATPPAAGQPPAA